MSEHTTALDVCGNCGRERWFCGCWPPEPWERLNQHIGHYLMREVERGSSGMRPASHRRYELRRVLASVKSTGTDAPDMASGA